jgi:hypothetical protein
MKCQCAWCLKVLNIYTGKWEQGPALVLPDASHGCCPECECRAKLEKASDTETGFQVRKTGRVKQRIAGTAGTGGQRRGHPKLMGEKP